MRKHWIQGLTVTALVLVLVLAATVLSEAQGPYSAQIQRALANISLTVSQLADGTDGELITWDASGVAATVPVGTATHVLTSNGAGAVPTFQAVTAGATSSDHLGFFAATTSAQLAGVISNETGTGSLVLATSPSLVTPALGTPSALVGTNITGTGASFTAGNVTTNANLTGPITSSGNATSIAAQTGTGTTFVMQASPTLTTPVLGAATGTSVDLGGTSLFASRALTVDTGGVFNVVLASAAGDDFTVDTSKLLVSGDSGNVGINTVDPGSKLEVAGDAANTSENSAQLQLIGSTDANKQLRIGYNTTANNGFIQAVRVGTGQDALLLNPEGGNVGIGVTPADKLDIDVGTGQVLIRTLNPDSLMITENDADIYGGEIALQKSRGSYASPGDVVNGDGLGSLKTSAWSGSAYWATAKIDYNIDGTFTSNQRPPSRMTFSTNAANAAVTERMRITGAGNVGIAETAPNDPLHITTGTAGAVTMIRLQHDNSSTNDAVSIDANMTSAVSTSAQINFKRVGTNAATDIIFSNTNTTGGLTERMRILRDGYIGMGTDAPTRQLHVGSATTDSVVSLTNSATGATNTDGFQLQEVSANAYVYNYENGNMSFGTNATERMSISAAGAVAVAGALSKGSGSFKIDHPLPVLNETHSLVHSFIEGPRADLIYRGVVTMVDGSATVDLDDAAGMTSGTWALLCRDPQVFSSNSTGWSAVRGTVSGSTLTIESEEGTSTDTVSWMVVAERQDQHIIDTEWTDEDGRPIIEPLKSPVAAPAPGITPDPDPV